MLLQLQLLLLLLLLLLYNNNKVARASAAARGVSFIFGRFFAPSPGMFVICEVFVNNRKFWCFGKPMFLGLFF